jgi:hypothetical protein
MPCYYIPIEKLFTSPLPSSVLTDTFSHQMDAVGEGKNTKYYTSPQKARGGNNFKTTYCLIAF